MKQQTFASLDYARQKQQTRSKQFLSAMARCSVLTQDRILQKI